MALVQSDMEWNFPVHMKEKKTIRKNTTVYTPVNGKIHSILLFEPAPAVKFWNSVNSLGICTVKVFNVPMLL